MFNRSRNILMVIITGLTSCLFASDSCADSKKNYSVQLLKSPGYHAGISAALIRHINPVSSIRLIGTSYPYIQKSYDDHEPDTNDIYPDKEVNYDKGIQFSLDYLHTNQMTDHLKLYFGAGPFYRNTTIRMARTLFWDGPYGGGRDETNEKSKTKTYGILTVLGFEYFITNKFSLISEFGMTLSIDKSQMNSNTVYSGSEYGVSFYDESFRASESKSIRLSPGIHRFGLSFYF